MKFSTDAQKTCYEKILPWMRQIFGDDMDTADDEPVIGVKSGSAYAQTCVHAYAEGEAVITTRAYVVTGVERNFELYEYLLRQNSRAIFGGFGVDPAGDVFFQHSIVGSTCDLPELEASVMSVALIADTFDDELVSRWGGQRACDRLFDKMLPDTHDADWDGHK